MKAKDIEPGGEYLAGKDGSGQYSSKTRARVIGPGDPKELPHGSRVGKTGQRVWEVEWLYDVDRGYGSIKKGERGVVASTWILRPWTDEDTERHRAADERAARSQDAAKRLMEAFGLQALRSGRFAIEREDEGQRSATLRVMGASGGSPEYVLSAAAVEKILSYYAEANEDRTAQGEVTE